MPIQEHTNSILKFGVHHQHDTAGNIIIHVVLSLLSASKAPDCEHGNLQLINFHLRDHRVLGKIRSDLHPAAGAEAAGRRASRGGHNAGRHRCSGSAGRARGGDSRRCAK